MTAAFLQVFNRFKKGAVTFFICLTACNPSYINLPPSDVVEIKKAESIIAEIRMRSGILNLSAGASVLMAAKYVYKVPTRQPVLMYEEKDGKGYLSLREEMVPSISAFPREPGLNQWDVMLNAQIPLELSIEFNKGKANLYLGDLNLARLLVQSGEGTMDIDLKNNLATDLYLKIDSGQGTVNLNLPQEKALRIIDNRGQALENILNFTKTDEGYVNSNYQKAKEHWLIDINVVGGKVNIF